MSDPQVQEKPCQYLIPPSEETIIDVSTAAGKEPEAAKMRNAIAMANLTMAFTSEAAMSLVYKAQSTDWPGGLAHLVVAALLEKYQPQYTHRRRRTEKSAR